MGKKVLYAKEARTKIADGVNKIADAVASTLGPMGRNVLISRNILVEYNYHQLPIHISKDGVTVAMAFDLDDPLEKPGVMMAKECTQKTVDQAGDGTTTTLVLMRAIVNEGIKLIDDGANPMQLKKEIDAAVEVVVTELQKMAVPIRGNIEKIRQIATVSANNDSSIGDMIADAFAKIGDEGIIDIEQSRGVNTTIKISDGYKFSSGWESSSSLFITNRDKQICEFQDPYILLYDKKILHHTQIIRALELLGNNPVLIVCDGAAEEGLAFLAMNNIAQNGQPARIRCCVVRHPSVGDARREEMEDIALLTGGTYISDIRGVDIKEMEGVNFGRARKVIVTKNETVIIGGINDGEEVENMTNELRMNLTKAESEEEKMPIEKRIARLNGGVAVIQVGATTETEMKEKMDRFDDSIRATKAAIAEGYIVGGGTAFLRFSDKMRNLNVIISKALEAPFIQICENAGIESDMILGEIITRDDFNIGYNARSGKVEDLIESGVIDPVKVLRCSLQNAASTAGMILTCECTIVDTQ